MLGTSPNPKPLPLNEYGQPAQVARTRESLTALETDTFFAMIMTMKQQRDSSSSSSNRARRIVWRILTAIILEATLTTGFATEAFLQAVEAVNQAAVLPKEVLLLNNPDWWLLAVAFRDAAVAPLPLTPPPATTTTTTTYLYDYEIPPALTEPRILLSPDEQELFQFLTRVRDYYCPQTTLRVAGGWVRDKLLLGGGGGSTMYSAHDVDIVVSHGTGVDFAKAVQRYLDNQQNDNPELVVPNNITIHYDYGPLAQHLQNARLQVGPFDVDVGKLRYERYNNGISSNNHNNRIPADTGRASVVQDAWRRDLTINSLYYNLHTQVVEDWTEQGLRDLQDGVIRTTAPEPLPTLLQDPLRLLRAARMVAKFPNFRLASGLRYAMEHDSCRLHAALCAKVSRHRMGQEMHALLAKSAHPLAGLQLLSPTILCTIFGVPCDDDKNAQQMVLALQVLRRTQALASRIWTPGSAWDVTRRTYLWYAACFHPLQADNDDDDDTCAAMDEQSNQGRRQRRIYRSIAYQCLTEGWGRPATEAQDIDKLLQGAQALQCFVDECFAVGIDDVSMQGCTKDKLADMRWQCYQLLKKVGPLWRESLVLMLANNTRTAPIDVDQAVQDYFRYKVLFEETLGLTDQVLFTNYKPMLNGAEIQSILPGVQGAGYRLVMAAQEEWSVRKGGGGAIMPTNAKDELSRYLVHKFPEFTKEEQSEHV